MFHILTLETASSRILPLKISHFTLQKVEFSDLMRMKSLVFPGLAVVLKSCELCPVSVEKKELI